MNNTSTRNILNYASTAGRAKSLRLSERSWRVWRISGLMSMVLRMIAGTVCRR
ncbi:hypothetical protein [Hoylesella timonensis]|uniref:hypothetical protein n=1 Tax=Hoylesella timonensis TaxID=386414 RepID=UPI001E316C7F|nr:hypothetical protein [Hoylesella timonensis]